MTTEAPILRPEWRDCAVGECVRTVPLPPGQWDTIKLLKLEGGQFVEAQFERRGEVWERTQ